jgi:hypothetical protein
MVVIVIPKARRIFNLNRGELMESRFDPITFGSDTMLNYQLSYKLNLIGRDKFNHLTITLTVIKLSMECVYIYISISEIKLTNEIKC